MARILEVFTDCEIQLRNATSKKILVEVHLMKAIDAARALSLNEVIDQLQQLRDEGGGEAIAAPVKPARQPKPAEPKSAPKAEQQKAAPEPAPKPEPDPVPQVREEPTPVAAPIVAEADLKGVWSVMIDALGMFSKAYFQEAFLKSVEDSVATIGFPEAFAPQMDLADTKEINQTLIDALGKAGHPVNRIQFVVAERPSDWAPLELGATGGGASGESGGDSGGAPKPPEGPIDMEEFKNDPLIQKALDVFKGQIVGVRK